MQGDLLSPSRAHSTTRVGRKVIIIIGGENDSHYNSVQRVRVQHSDPALVAPDFHHDELPPPRLGHTTVVFEYNKTEFGRSSVENDGRR